MADPLGYLGTHAAVTGAASGIGEATARILTALGADVTAIDLRPTTAPVTRSLLVDLRDKAAIEHAAAELGPVDSLFNCAGAPGPPFTGGNALGALDTMIVNFIGPRHLIELAIPAMTPGAAIVLVASASGFQWLQKIDALLPLVTSVGFDEARIWCEANPDIVDHDTYFLSKEALNAWTAWRSSGLIRERGIRLNCTNPGSVETPMMDVFRGLMPDPPLGPIGRLSTPEEQAWPLLALNSPRFGYVTGQSLVVDGGMFGAMTTGQPIA